MMKYLGIFILLLGVAVVLVRPQASSVTETDNDAVATIKQYMKFSLSRDSAALEKITTAVEEAPPPVTPVTMPKSKPAHPTKFIMVPKSAASVAKGQLLFLRQLFPAAIADASSEFGRVVDSSKAVCSNGECRLRVDVLFRQGERLHVVPWAFLLIRKEGQSWKIAEIETPAGAEKWN